MTRFRLTFAAALLWCVPTSAPSQLPPLRADEGPAPVVTPVEWKWDRLDQDTYFYVAGDKDRPLVLSVPGAPGDGAGGFNQYLERFLADEGYALGVLSWRGDFHRTAKPTAIVARAFADLVRIRAKGQKRFDPSRIILLGQGDGAFLAMLLAADSNRLQSAGIPIGSTCATILMHPTNLDPASTSSYLARRQFSQEPEALNNLAPLKFASSAPPTLILTELLDREDERRSDAAAAVLRAGGRTVVQASYARFEAKNERTYFGWHENSATQKLGEFLRTYCPAKKG